MKRVLRTFACLCMVLSLCLGTVGCGFAYLKADLSKYVTLNLDSLSNLNLTLSQRWEVSDQRVEEAIHTLLLAYKEAVNEGEKETDAPVGDGDVVGMYYQMVDPSGNLLTDGFSVAQAAPGRAPFLMEVGAGDFPLEKVEQALMGITPGDYALKNSGAVEQGKVIYATYTYHDTRGGVEGPEQSGPAGMVRMDLSTADALYGDGFSARVVGQEIGGAFFDVEATLTDGEETFSRTYRMQVRYMAEGELVIEDTYPLEYEIEARRGLTVTVYVQPVYMVDYEVPPLNAQTVQEVMGLFTTSQDPVADLTQQVRNLLLTEEERLTALEEALWQALEPLATYHKLPKKEVRQLTRGFKKDLVELYDACLSDTTLYSACVAEFGEGAMESPDTFAHAMYGGEAGQSAKDYLRPRAEAQVKQDLVIYTLALRFHICPDEEELQAGVDALIEAAMADTSLSEKQLLRRYGGRDYFEAQYYYQYVLTYLSIHLDVTYN